MGIAESSLFYGVIGCAVAAALALSATRAEDSECKASWWQLATAVFFWPIYLPVLLSREADSLRDHEATEGVTEIGERAGVTRRETGGKELPSDELGLRIALVERELSGALASLDGWAEETLARERPRIAELRNAWHWQAERIRELDRLLVQPNVCDGEVPKDVSNQTGRLAQCEAARRQNVTRLHAIRQQAEQDLATTLASVREIVSMIHLAKFTGAPPARADELVTQIAAAVEGLSEAASWHDRATMANKRAPLAATMT